MDIFRTTGILEKMNLQHINAHMAYSGRNNRIYKMPASPEEISRSNLLSMMQRIHCKNFLQLVEEKPRTSRSSSFDGLIRPTLSRSVSTTDTMDEFYERHSISEGSRGFIGHGMGMYGNDDYLEDTIKAPFAAIRQYDVSRPASHLSIDIWKLYLKKGVRFYIPLEECSNCAMCLKSIWRRIQSIVISYCNCKCVDEGMKEWIDNLIGKYFLR